jgi:hypothetical protein
MALLRNTTMAWSRKIIVFAAVALVIAATTIYSVWQSPHDLTLKSVEVIRGQDMLPADGYRGVPEAYEPMALVRFNTTANLAKFGMNYWYAGVFVETYLCRGGSNAVISKGFSLVFDELGGMSLYQKEAQRTGRHEYHIYVQLRSQGRHAKPGDAGAMRYDLVEDPEDVCFVLVPNFSFVGHWPPTNEVVIPKDVLARAIERRVHQAGP